MGKEISINSMIYYMEKTIEVITGVEKLFDVIVKQSCHRLEAYLHISTIFKQSHILKNQCMQIIYNSGRNARPNILN
jgi:hypothetical protein